jgi:hypothetical protein
MDKNQRQIELHGKVIYVATTNGGWAIIIMPDEIILDDYHNKGGHIHPEPFKHEKEIIIKNEELDTNLQIVLNHINKNKGLKLKELIEELK